MVLFFIIIAEQLVSQLPYISPYVGKTITSKPLREQFKKLIFKPVSKGYYSSCNQLIIIVVNTLDKYDYNYNIQTIN